jgi:hypothetical protein
MRGIKAMLCVCLVTTGLGVLHGQEKERPQSSSPPAKPGNPLLFLIRDSTVQTELGLTPQQKTQVRELTDKLDVPLWSLRDWGAEQGGPKLQELLTEAETGLASILKDAQQRRLEQIVLRVQGTAILVRADVVERLKLTSEQQRKIQRILDGESSSTQRTAANEKADSKAKANSKEKSNQKSKPSANEVQRAKEAEAKAAAAVLTDSQTRQLSTLLGKPFSLPQGYKIAIKAPELATADGWVNSEALTIEQLRGQVVVLNFWTYG